MEFRRAYWNETPNAGLMARHEREIFPLLRRRHLFAGVESCILYDFFSTDGTVNEDVFAYSNARGGERGLVLYNNRYADARGWVRMSAAYAVKTGSGKTLVQKCLGEGLGLPNDPACFALFRDHASGLQYIRGCRDLWEMGLYAELGAYRCQVFLEFSVVRDDDKGRWSGLASDLGGRGVPSMDAALRERELRPVRDAFRTLLLKAAPEARDYSTFLAAAAPFSSGRIAPAEALEMFARLDDSGTPDRFLRAWRILKPLAGSVPAVSPVPSWMEEWMLGDILAAGLAEAGYDGQTPTPALFAVLLSIPEKPRTIDWALLFAHPAAERLFGVHEFEGTRWLRKESLQMFAACVTTLRRATTAKLLAAAKSAEYRWDDFLTLLSTPSR
jgi:hypothetical protein